MLVAPLIDSSGAEKGLQFGVGEVVNGEYRVRSVEADEQGRIIHKCSRLSNGENVVVLFEGRNGKPGAERLHQRSPATPSTTGMQRAGRFEVQFGKDMFAYVVYAERVVKASNRQQADVKRAKASEAAQRRPAPLGSRCVAHRKGDCDCGACGISVAVFFVAFVSIIAYAVVHRAFVFNLAVGVISLILSLWSVFFACGSLLFALADVFEHEILIVTPTYFKIKRGLDFNPRQRDSVNNATAAAEELERPGGILCRQISGRTRNLWKAKVKIRVKGDSASSDTATTDGLVLMEREKDYRLGMSLSLEERVWLAEEINEVLDAIRQQNS